MNKTGDLDQFLIGMYYAKNQLEPYVSLFDPFQRLRINVQLNYEGWDNPDHDLSTQHLIGANAMIKALTLDEKIMLYNRYSDPAHLELIEDMSERSYKQFRKEIKEHLMYKSEFENIIKQIL